MSDAVRLVDSIRAELAPLHERLVAHPYVAAVEEGRLQALQLRPFAGEQYAIISSDLRSVAQLVSRFGGVFFLDILAGERAALEALPPFAAALGMSEQDLRDFEPMPGAHAYAAYMSAVVGQTDCGRLCRTTFPALPGRDLRSSLTTSTPLVLRSTGLTLAPIR